MASLNRTKTPLGTSFASNIPRSTPMLGRRKAFEGVIKAVSARKASISLKMTSGEQNSPKNNTPVRSATTGRKSKERYTPLSSVPEQQEVDIREDLDLDPLDFTVNPKVIDNSGESNANNHATQNRLVPGSAPLKIIFSTLSPFSSGSSISSTSSDGDISSIHNIAPILSSGLSEEEELQVVGSSAFFGGGERETKASEKVHITSIRAVAPISAPVFLPEPSKSELKIERLIKPTEEEPIEHPNPVEHTVRRKPVPAESLASASREALLSKVAATRPITSSLLSFTDETPVPERRRQYPERVYKTRNAIPDSDILRKSCVERRRLYRTGLLFSPLPSISSFAPKFYLYPRAGDLSTLHSDESTSVAEDYYLSYVDLSFIRKTLFAFDMRMRTGRELWGNEVEEEIYRFFGRKGEWEKEWDIKWKVAAWLLHQVDEEEVEDTEEEVEVEV